MVYDYKQKYDFFKIVQAYPALTLTNKRDIIGTLFSDYEDNWAPIGITVEALKRCADFDFKEVSNKKRSAGLERAHISGRAKTFETMLTTEWQSAEEWWNFYQENNHTILALSSENKAIGVDKNSVKWISIDQGYFKNAAKGYKYTKRDREYLIQLFKSLDI